ncbi:MAG: DUF5627 domain-containing protein [Bacteroidales bacterium]|nr:DUF5627 domain-containing protein [Bacteroidales bacterium]MCF8390439.1 DUF5627 domain-containing protein [Bacteroidales bacterium]
MKNLTILSLIIFWVLSGCDKYEPFIQSKENEFPDFDYTAVYFPIQYPIRTIDLATDARIDNSNDLDHKFHIGISIGGVYTNQQNREVKFEYAPYLLPDSFKPVTSLGSTLDTLIVLPSNYYEMTPSSGSFLTIPTQKYSGLIEIQLKDEFFADPLSYKNTFVIPLLITEASNVDSILSGLPLVADPVRTSPADWDPSAPARDFTLFMVKYINNYHGDYLLRGVDYTLDATNNRIDTLVYSTKYLTDNKIVELRTSGLSQIYTNNIGSKISSTGNNSLELEIDASGSVNIGSIPDSVYQVSGTGTFLSREESGEVWGKEGRKAFYLHYNYMDGIVSHEVYDTLVFRNTGTVIEWFAPPVE